MDNGNLWRELVMVVAVLLVGLAIIVSTGGVTAPPIEPEITQELSDESQ